MPARGVFFETLADDADMKAAAGMSRSDWWRMWWQFVALCVVATAIASVSKDFSAKVDSVLPEATINASTFNKRQTGYSGFLELLQKAGIKAGVWELPYRDLLVQKGTLIIIAPIYPASPFEIDQLLKWVKQGNNLVYLDHFGFGAGRKFLLALDLDTAGETSQIRNETLRLTDGDASKSVADHVNQVFVTANQRLSGADAPLLSDDKGTFLSEASCGDGKCLVGTVPTLASNFRFSEKPQWDNLQLLLNWIRSAGGGGKVWFDERAHGYSSAANLLLVVSRGPSGLIILQLLIIFLVALLSLGQRFCAKRQVPVVRRISNLEYIEGLANTYQRARAYDMAYHIMFVQLRNKLCRALGISPEDDLTDLATPWAEAVGERPETCAAFLKDSHEASENRHLTIEEFKKLMAQCDSLTVRSAELIGMRGAK
jgi:hypothetical protein